MKYFSTSVCDKLYSMKNYVLRDPIPEKFRKELGAYNPLVQELLYFRGIENLDEAERFLNPNYETHIHDPYLLKDMDKAVERIISTIQKEEKIAIYSDYDADGIPGAVVLNDFFKKINYKNIITYIPLRNEEGFGLNHDAIENIISQGVKLLITIDCGISDLDEVSRASKNGLDVIITDHHLPKDNLPEAFAVINPKREDCSYPEKMLCGSGVVFKLVQALVKHPNVEFKEGHEKWMLDMVGLATLSDMVPLLGENRVLAHYGLKVFQKSPRPGLRKLLSLVKVNQNNLTEDDIAFMVTPRINAASRMGVPMDAFKLLSTDDEVEADIFAKHLDGKNNERKGLVASMIKEIKKKIEKRDYEMKQVLVLGNPEWKPSLLGLVANSFSDEHGRPVFLWGREGVNGDSVIKGSCRSSGNMNIVSLMEKAKDAFLEYGGHSGAGGFSVSVDNIHHLEEKLNNAFLKLQKEIVSEKVLIDKKISIDDVNWETYKHVEKFSPFGFENPKPLFLIEGIEVKEVKIFGKEKNHLELIFQNSKGQRVSSIMFFYAPEKFSIKLEKGVNINMVATMEKSVFKSYPELRLRIVDIFN